MATMQSIRDARQSTDANRHVFDKGSSEAYVHMGALPPSQQWSAFDVPREEARAGRAKLFLMTVWNGAYDKNVGRYTTWDICHDPFTDSYWYCVPRQWGDTDNAKRTALWNSLRIATDHGVRMLAMLKDGRTGRCSTLHYFDIERVAYELDGSALWLKLRPGPDGVGAGTQDSDLSRLDILPQHEPGTQRRAPKLTRDQYGLAAALAELVRSGTMSRAAAIAQLQEEQAVTEGSAGALLNNYRCLLTGQAYKAPMSADATVHFIRQIICLHGNSAISAAAAALKGYIEYASSTFGDAATMREILAGLDADQAQIGILTAAEAALREATQNKNVQTVQPDLCVKGAVDNRPSELERLVWVRGPQHREFRNALLDRWDGKCSVHGVECNGQLRASHIVPWSVDESLRGDPNNGLLLAVPLDNLFDQGLISFDDEGKLLTSNALTADTIKHFGLSASMAVNWQNLQPIDRSQMRKHLGRHRAQHSSIHGYRP